jgi:GNAT superfamily N-acetyltransferase
VWLQWLALAVRSALDQGPTIAMRGARHPGQFDAIDDIEGWSMDDASAAERSTRSWKARRRLSRACLRRLAGGKRGKRPHSVAAGDSELIREFVHSLSFETRYLRFMSVVKELSPQTVDRLTRIDHRCDAALIAIVNEQGVDRVVGVTRYVLDADSGSCEFAIVLADDWRRLGLGRRLMTLLVDTASARGLKRIRGDVLGINRSMLAFVKALGFNASASNDDPTIRRVELAIA